MWSEDQAAELVKSGLPHMRESIARAQRAVAEIEATIITVEEEQDAAKEAISRDAA